MAVRVLPHVTPPLQQWISRGMKRCRRLEEVARASSETFDGVLEAQRPNQLAVSILVLVDLHFRIVIGHEREGGAQSAVT